VGGCASRSTVSGVPVEQLERALETRELHHGVGDLAHPERRQALVEAAQALGAPDHGRAAAQRGRRAGHGLDAHLARLHRRQQHVGQQLGRRASRQVQTRAPRVRQLLQTRRFSPNPPAINAHSTGGFTDENQKDATGLLNPLMGIP